MSKLTERASYLKGLAEGLKLNTEKDSNRILLEALDLIEDMAKELADVSDAQDALDEYVDAIDEDLSAMEEALFDDEDEDAFDDEDEDAFDEEDSDEDESDEDEEDSEDDGDEAALVPGENEIIVYECPSCGTELRFRAADIDFDEDALCPVCGKPIFPSSTAGEEE